MAKVTFDHVTKMFGEVAAVDDFTLEVADGEFLVLVGPSGCGKSTALRLLAGLEEISSGDVYIGGDLVTNVRAKDRNIAMVFQTYALYPHMSLFDNMAFGLKLRKTPREEIRQRVHAAAEILGVEDLLERKPSQLSGGQRQREELGLVPEELGSAWTAAIASFLLFSVGAVLPVLPFLVGAGDGAALVAAALSAAGVVRAGRGHHAAHGPQRMALGHAPGGARPRRGDGDVRHRHAHRRGGGDLVGSPRHVTEHGAGAVRSFGSPLSFCWMNRCRTSTPSCAYRRVRKSASCTNGWARPSSTSPTIRRRR